jgi:peptidylprolyl isomerase
MSVRRLVALLIVSLIALAGCGSSKASDSDSLPTASGKFGEKPVIKLPKGQPSKTLESKTLIQGNGPVVAKGQLLVANYLGETFRDGKVFDNSYDRKAPAGFSIGVGKVIPGWDEKLVGVKAGSRVLLTIPPDKGYGSQGQPNAGIKGDDTLVFVVDVVAAYDPAAGASGTPVAAGTTGTLPAVTGPGNKKPTVTIPKGKAPPAKLVLKTVIQGTGPAVTKGQTVAQQYVVVNWTTGKQLDSTWDRKAPVAVPVGSGQLLPGWDQALTGAKVGSRILAVVPPDKGFGKAGKADIGVKPTDTLVFVFDVIGAN